MIFLMFRFCTLIIIMIFNCTANKRCPGVNIICSELSFDPKIIITKETIYRPVIKDCKDFVYWGQFLFPFEINYKQNKYHLRHCTFLQPYSAAIDQKQITFIICRRQNHFQILGFMELAHRKHKSALFLAANIHCLHSRTNNALFSFQFFPLSHVFSICN